MDEFPRLWCLVCLSTNTVEYSNTRYTAVKGFFDGIPEQLRSQFYVVRYDPNENYSKNETVKER